MIRALLLCLSLWPAAALAQSLTESLPALFTVSGVDENDMLNVRAGPGTDFEIIGKLEPDASGVEVVDTDPTGEWGLVNLDDRAGWVAMRYLVRGPGQPDHGLPNILTCGGTEPFWDFRLAPDRSAEFTRPDQQATFSNVHTVTSENRPDRHALFADGGNMVITAVVGRNLCSDGMSDRAYGLSIDLLVTDAAEVHVYSGCCSVAP